MAVYFPYHQTLFPYLLAGREDELRRRREEPARSLTAGFMSLLPWRTARGSLASDVLRLFQVRVEACLAEVIRTKSVYYWLHLSRRFAPGDNFAGESPQTVWLYSNMENCAYLKYGRLDSSADFVDYVRPEDSALVASGNYVKANEFFGMGQRSGLVPSCEYLRDLDFNSLVEHASVRRLVFEYWHTTACLRRLYKGGTLVIDDTDPSEYHVYNDDETESLMKSYDERQGRGGALTTTIGLPISLEDIKESGEAVGYCPVYNVHGITEAQLPQSDLIFRLKTLTSFGQDDSTFTPNFVWFPVDFSRVLDTNEFCDTQFAAAYGVSMAKFLLCLYTVSSLGTNRHIWTDRKAMGLETMQRAYSFWTSLGDLAKTVLELSNEAGSFLQPDLAVSRVDVDRVLGMLLLTDTTREAISLTTLGPRPLLVPSGGERVLLDYAALAPILHSFAHGLENVGEKGALFEEYLERVVGALPNVTPLWFSQKLHAGDGSSREIDASFTKGEVLFLCELKCINMSWSFVEGTQDALNFRRGKCEQGLKEADDKAQWLAKHPFGNNYLVPEEVSVIVPLLVSPFVEYVWSRNPTLWLSHELPRICTPAELAEVDPDTAVARPFARKVLRD